MLTHPLPLLSAARRVLNLAGPNLSSKLVINCDGRESARGAEGWL